MAAMVAATFRLALPSDFHEVVRLSEDVFPIGRDYLVHRFHQWQKRNNIAVMLAFSEGRLVGLQACFIVDDGRTFVRQAMRTRPELQGKGLSRQLSEAMDEYVRRNFPNVCRLRFTSYLHHNFATPTKRLLELDNLGYIVNSETPRLEKLEGLVGVEQCTRYYLSSFLLPPSVARNIFPDNLIVLDWVPFEALRSNIDYILQENDCIFVEKCVDDDSVARSCSFGRLSTKARVMEWLVSVYTDDHVLLEVHLVHQFNHARKIIDGDFSFVTFQATSLRSHGKRVMEEVLRLKPDEFYQNESLFLYERDF